MSVSRSGVSWRAFFHQASKWRAEADVGRARGRRRTRTARPRPRRGRGGGRAARARPPARSAAVLSRKKWCLVCQSPSTRACLMNSSRASTGSIRRSRSWPVGDDRDAVQGDLLGRDGGAERPGPAGLAVGPLDQVLRRSARPTPARSPRPSCPTAAMFRPVRPPRSSPAASWPGRSRGRRRTWRRGRRGTPAADGGRARPGRGRCRYRSRRAGWRRAPSSCRRGKASRRAVRCEPGTVRKKTILNLIPSSLASDDSWPWRSCHSRTRR